MYKHMLTKKHLGQCQDVTAGEQSDICWKDSEDIPLDTHLTILSLYSYLSLTHTTSVSLSVSLSISLSISVCIFIYLPLTQVAKFIQLLSKA